ncbi:DNA cytosine methyltransferase [Veillonella caviae]|uniref:DNA cytosine methyltransferase n=1 Tax=Veillonella caviae TaxID=248316 RepID=UPI002A917B7B|nr:DNA cytosine methyltransferase [Veillonella caviae]MDY5786924.1 DNA cytosine methyltransferase [Veillonella caviae]
MSISVSSNNTKKYTVAAFFSGVGGIELGFEQTNKFRVVYANEFDENANRTYKLNFPNVPLDSRDIHKVNVDEVDDTDLIVGGFPCQAFSIAGYRKGFEDERGDLFFELLRIIEGKQPKAIFIENVKNMVTHNHGKTFKVIKEALTLNGYFIKWKVLNGKDYGNIPQNRERIYIVGFKNKDAFDGFSFPGEINLSTKLSDIIDFTIEEDEYYYYSKQKNKFYDELEKSITKSNTVYQWRRQYVRENKNGVVPTLTANMGMGGHNVPLIFTYDGRIRKLTPKETFNAQGYPANYLLPKDMAKSHLYKQAGNSVVVPLVKRIATNIADSLNLSKSSSNIKINYNLPFAIMYTNMNGRYDGEAYIVNTSNHENTLHAKIDKINTHKSTPIEVLTDEEYLSFVQKNLKKEFYSILKND